MILMGVGVFAGNASVGSPAGVADAAVGDIGKLLYFFTESCYLSNCFYKINLEMFVKIGNSSTVIAAVFQACKAVEKDSLGFQGTGISNNSTHN